MMHINTRHNGLPGTLVLHNSAANTVPIGKLIAMVPTARVSEFVINDRVRPVVPKTTRMVSTKKKPTNQSTAVRVGDFWENDEPFDILKSGVVGLSNVPIGFILGFRLIHLNHGLVQTNNQLKDSYHQKNRVEPK